MVVLICCSKRPQKFRDLSNICFIMIDLFLVVILTVYGTNALFGESGLECRDNGDPNTFKWWVISVCCLVYGWVYSLLLLVGLTSLPLIIVFWCFYRMQMSEIENESRLQHIPVAGEIIRSLKR